MADPRCPIHPKAEMRPTKPFRALFDVEPPVPAVKCTLCAYCCRAELEPNGSELERNGSAKHG